MTPMHATFQTQRPFNPHAAWAPQMLDVKFLLYWYLLSNLHDRVTVPTWVELKL
jgi:hypothetical protein